MCRIASLFLLQWLKGSMSDDARDFNNMESRAVINFIFLQAKALKEIHAILTETLGEYASSYVTVKNWMAQFKRGDFCTCGTPRPGRRKTVNTPEIIDQIHKLILEDCRISAQSKPEQVGISSGRVRSIIHEDLNVRKHNLNQIRIWDFRTMTLCRWRRFGRTGAFIPQLQHVRYKIFEAVVLNEQADRIFCVL